MSKQTKKQFLVVGLGRFGTSLCKALYRDNADVLAIDEDQEKVNEIDNFCTQAVCANATDERVLTRLAVNNFDVAAVCISKNIEASIFVTLMLKQLGVKYVIAKAQNKFHKTVLEKIGADSVVIPEEEMGEKLAASLSKPNMIEVMSLTDNFKIVEIKTPQKWQNKTLVQLNLRNTEKVSVILIKRGDEVIVTPGGTCALLPDDILVIAGQTSDTERLSKKTTQSVLEE